MQIGVIGLGRMGANIALRLMRHGHDIVAYDRTPLPARRWRAMERPPAAISTT